MLIHETFLRCPKCNDPYFSEQRKVLLNKDLYLQDKIFVDKILVSYQCVECQYVLPLVDEQEFYVPLD